MKRASLQVTGYRVLFDRQKEGFPASDVSCSYANGTLSLAFQKASDGARGLRPWVSQTHDLGLTWSEPAAFGPDIDDPANEFLKVSLMTPTTCDTELAVGYHVKRGTHDRPIKGEIAWRPSGVIVGRRATGEKSFQWNRYPTGRFLGEQFTYAGLTAHNGRIVASIWGAKERGENWRCGVLLSDDDGMHWRYRDVGFAPNPTIRNDPDKPAGYNEQTLFETRDGMLVSIIRGANKLGRIPGNDAETFFFRSVSEDSGETWSPPEPTNLPGTGAGTNGLTLPDGSLVIAARVPHNVATTCVSCENPTLFGLHIARSFDLGKTWETAHTLQHGPTGDPFDNYYHVMNGRFVPLGGEQFLYVFGHFEYARDGHRVYAVTLSVGH